jgi:hypothetical protein
VPFVNDNSLIVAVFNVFQCLSHILPGMSLVFVATITSPFHTVMPPRVFFIFTIPSSCGDMWQRCPQYIYWDVTATLDPVGRTEGRHPHDSAKAQHLDRIVQSHVGCLFLLVLQSAGRLLAFFGSSQQCYSHACLHNATSVYYFDSYFVRLLATVACHTSYFFAIPTDVIKF